MPKFRFETPAFDQTTTVAEVLASIDLANLKAAELANAALKAAAPTGDYSCGSLTKVYDEAGYLVATVSSADVTRNSAQLASPDADSSTEEPGVIRSG